MCKAQMILWKQQHFTDENYDSHHVPLQRENVVYLDFDVIFALGKKSGPNMKICLAW